MTQVCTKKTQHKNEKQKASIGSTTLLHVHVIQIRDAVGLDIALHNKLHMETRYIKKADPLLSTGHILHVCPKLSFPTFSVKPTLVKQTHVNLSKVLWKT